MDGFTRQFLRQWSLSAVSVLLTLAILIIDQSMAAMIGPGNVAALSYGWKVVGTLWGLGPFALGTVVLPYMSRYSAREDHKKLVRILKINALIALVATIPVATALVMWTEPLTRLLFQRGAFSPQDTFAVAGVQAMYALGLPFMALYTLGARVLSAVLLNGVLAISS
jgi:putative peptidoglycan lipid II flippase